jgi:hypothetical protein
LLSLEGPEWLTFSVPLLAMSAFGVIRLWSLANATWESERPLV